MESTKDKSNYDKLASNGCHRLWRQKLAAVPEGFSVKTSGKHCILDFFGLTFVITIMVNPFHLQNYLCKREAKKKKCNQQRNHHFFFTTVQKAQVRVVELLYKSNSMLETVLLRRIPSQVSCGRRHEVNFPSS